MEEVVYKGIQGKLNNQLLKYHSKDELLQGLKTMVSSRTIDHKVLTLLKQGKAGFLIAGAGHEATQVAFGEVLESGVDWAYPYYRDMSFIMALGVTHKEIILEMLGKADDPANGGRQMPNHWGSKRLNIPSQSSTTGTQYLQAVGTAMAFQKQGESRVGYVSSGEGTTKQCEFTEPRN